MESSPLPKLTVLLGAGSTIHAGAPSTQSLTETVSRLKFPVAVFPTAGILWEPDTRPMRFSTETQAIVPWLWRLLKGTFREPDFETLLHLTEEMESFSFSKTNTEMLDEFRHVLAAIFDFRQADWFMNQPSVLRAAREVLIRTMMGTVARPLRFRPLKSELKTLFDLLRARFSLRVFTLNYDDLIDIALEEYFDGFVQGPSNSGAFYFDKKEFTRRMATENLVLAHLHGSVRFGYDFPKASELAKFPNRDAAIDSLIGKGHSWSNDHGNNVSSAPIISGYNKVLKLTLNPIPYGYYYRAFVDSVLACPRMLVIGYGSGDNHVNTWLEEFKDIHDAERRLAWVTKLGSNDPYQTGKDTKLFAKLAGRDGMENCVRMIEAPEEAAGQRIIPCGLTQIVVPSGFPFISSETTSQIIDFLAT